MWRVILFRKENGKEPVTEFLLALQDGDRAKAMQPIKLLTEYGVLLKEPYSRQVHGKVRELRASGRMGEIRILYFLHTDRTFVLLNAFVKKTQKTPQREIGIALKRMKTIINAGGRT